MKNFVILKNNKKSYILNSVTEETATKAFRDFLSTQVNYYNHSFLLSEQEAIIQSRDLQTVNHFLLQEELQDAKDNQSKKA